MTSYVRYMVRMLPEGNKNKFMLTVFNEDVDCLFSQTVCDDVLVGLHHVGAEDLLVVFFGHIYPGCSHITFQQVVAAFLRWKCNSLIFTIMCSVVVSYSKVKPLSSKECVFSLLSHLTLTYEPFRQKKGS